MIHYELNPVLESPDWHCISKLFERVKWGKRPVKNIENSFRKSAFVLVVKDNNQIIGLGRTVDDGQYYALIVDVIIHPDYQGQGIGTKIVNELSKQLSGYEFQTLTAAPGKEGFYKKIGWRKQKSAFILPKDATQIKEHCE